MPAPNKRPPEKQNKSSDVNRMQKPIAGNSPTSMLRAEFLEYERAQKAQQAEQRSRGSRFGRWLRSLLKKRS